MSQLHTSASVNRKEQIREAWRLALLGDTEGAKGVLRALDQRALSVDGADLLARLAVRDGCLEEARCLWTAILEVDPTHEPSVKALVCLDSPWLFRAVCRRLITMLVLGGGISLAAIGAWAMLVNIPDGYLSVLLAACLTIFVATFLAGVGVWFLCAAGRVNRASTMARKEDPAGVHSRRGVGMTAHADGESGSGPERAPPCPRVPHASASEYSNERGAPVSVPARIGTLAATVPTQSNAHGTGQVAVRDDTSRDH